MYDTTQTKSLFKNIQSTPTSTDGFSFLGNKSISLPTTEPEDIYIPDEKTQAKIDACGRWYTFFDPATGKPRTYQKTCNICWQCIKSQAIERVCRLGSEPVYTVTISNDDWQAIHKHLKREDIMYQRIKQNDDESVILLECDDPYFGELERISEVTVEQMENWLRNKEKGSRITGKLGAKQSSPSSDDDEDGETVQVFFDMICTNATYEQQRAALKISITNTSDLIPDETSLQEALNKRTGEYKKALLEIGCRIISTVETSRYVQISRIDWNGSNSDTRYLDTVRCTGGEKDGPVPF